MVGNNLRSAMAVAVCLAAAAMSGCAGKRDPTPNVATAPASTQSANGRVRTITSLDGAWKFSLDASEGAQATGFDDAHWRTVDVPHDWSIEGPFDRNAPTRGSGGFLPAGTGWYRKTIDVPAASKGRRVFLEFEGVMANSDVWINGHHLGHRPYGYASFRYDATDHVRFGGANVIAVRADNSKQPASRWYTGAGIYRHARMITSDAVHLVGDGTYIATPHVLSNQATLEIWAEAANTTNAPAAVTLRTEIFAPDGTPVTTVNSRPVTVAPGRTHRFVEHAWVPGPQLWDIERGRMYRAQVSLVENGRTRDDDSVPFGIREFLFEPDRGFEINTRVTKIKGVCLHHDGGAVGAAVPSAVWERRLNRLRQIGVNGIRTAHNPPDPSFLDLCDRMGFVVMDEAFDAWRVGKNPFDYHRHFDEWSKRDVRDMVRRDRNHPSVVIYSAGNEIHDTPRAEQAKAILRGLIDTFHEHDPFRPVTQALFRPNVSRDYDNGLADMLDVVGQNYRENELIAAANQNPRRKIIGTENGHQRAAWLPFRDDRRMAGQFLWTGVDYLGESRTWPTTGSGAGLLDRAGNFKPGAYERMSWWSTTPMVYIARRTAPPPPVVVDPGYEQPQPATAASTAPTSAAVGGGGGGGGGRGRGPSLFGDWTPRDLGPHEETVEVYSNMPDVELILNDRSLGTKPINADAAPRVWKVPFEPGIIRAEARRDGKVVATHQHRTAGKPAALRATVERATFTTAWEDLGFVDVEVVDENGTIVPTATDTVSFEVVGPAKVLAVDNGDTRSHEKYQATTRASHQGRTLAILRGTGRGKVVVRATAPGLSGAEAVLEVK